VAEPRTPTGLNRTKLLRHCSADGQPALWYRRKKIVHHNRYHAYAAVADGDVTIDIPHTGNHDEIGAMAAAIAVFRQNAAEAAQLRAAQDEERRRIGAEKQMALQAMAETVERESSHAVAFVAEETGRMADSTRDMATSAELVGTNAQGVAAAAAQALSNVQSVSAVSERLSGAIAEISHQVNTATGITGRAVTAATGAEEIISQLAHSVEHIGEVTRMIATIAKQTNLLALNATVEAAGAGGRARGSPWSPRGQDLANQTTPPAIACQIGDIQATAPARGGARSSGHPRRRGGVVGHRFAGNRVYRQRNAATYEQPRHPGSRQPYHRHPHEAHDITSAPGHLAEAADGYPLGQSLARQHGGGGPNWDHPVNGEPMEYEHES
jgi:hypothetical protein